MMARLRSALLLLNTHAIGVAGGLIATSAIIRLGNLLSDSKTLLSLYDRIALHRDPYNAVPQVASAIAAMFVGLILCYLGAPVTVHIPSSGATAPVNPLQPGS